MDRRKRLQRREEEHRGGERLGDDRVSREWLGRYLEHYRRELSPRELGELADALHGGVTSTGGLVPLVTRRTASESRGLVEFLANLNPARRQALAREAIIRLRAAAQAR
jgi:hypothetical protein